MVNNFRMKTRIMSAALATAWMVLMAGCGSEVVVDDPPETPGRSMTVETRRSGDDQQSRVETTPTSRQSVAEATAPGVPQSGAAGRVPAQAPDAGVDRTELITVYPDSRWGELMVSFTDAERRCMRDGVGADFERVMSLPVLSGGEPQQHEVDIFECLSRAKAGRLFVAMMKADLVKPVSAMGEGCLYRLLARTDLAAVYRTRMDAAGDDDGTDLVRFAADVAACLAGGGSGDEAPEPMPAAPKPG